MKSILVVEDDGAVRELLKTFLAGQGLRVSASPNVQEALAQMMEEGFDAIVLDMMRPDSGCLAFLEGLSEPVPVIVTTAYASVKSAVEAIKLGAFDYLIKPLDLEELLAVLRRALDARGPRRDNTGPGKQLRQKYGYGTLRGYSRGMQELQEMVGKIANSEATVIIYGESGTGKELVARTIHLNSPRARGAFVPVNCAAIPRDLLESELFGHERGAFTGATSARVGRFELAKGGTIFLDEIGELHPSLQVKLLRVLQEREFERLGGARTIKADTRILAATNRDLELAVREGAFREDLYYRLSVIPLRVPPLRERRSDIPVLAESFMKKFTKKNGKNPLKIYPEAMNRLLRYPWPGNVRELENLIERLVILDETGEVTAEELPDGIRYSSKVVCLRSCDVKVPEIALPKKGFDINHFLSITDANLITQALETTGGVKSRAAAKLGLNRTTFLVRLKRTGISGLR